MPPTDDYQDLARYQDVLGQLPMLQAYNHLLYTFPLNQKALRDEVVTKLEGAITTVRTTFPWMGARVINEGKTAESSGLYRVIPCQPPKEPLTVRDLSDNFPPYEEIKSMKAPVSVFKSTLLAPVTSFPSRFDDSVEGPAHVVRLQATFIEGGVILNFAIHQIVADGTGLYGFVKLIALIMRGESISNAVLLERNRDRRTLFPLLSPHEAMLDHSHYKRPPITQTSPLVEPEPSNYHMFRFTEANIRKLKDLAGPPESSDINFVSPDDALCAFIWQRYTAIRSHRFPRETRSRFSRAMDGHKLVGLMRDYLGATIHNVASWLTFGELVDMPMFSVAVHLRRRLNEANTTYHLRSFATFIAEEPDKSVISYAGRFNADTDIGCTSVHGHLDVFPEFGVLGRPDFIRRPPTTPFPSLVALLPGSPAGDFQIWTCLKDADLAALRGDAKWNEFVSTSDKQDHPHVKRMRHF